jgi:PAS domain S-box-containing protein
MGRRIRIAEWLLPAGVLAALAAAVTRVLPLPSGLGEGLLGASVLALASSALILWWHARRAGRAETEGRRLLEAACDAVVVIGPDRRIAHLSVRAAALFGYPARELIGQPLSQLIPEWSPSPADWPTAVQGRTAAETAVEFPGRTRDGTALALEVMARPTSGPPQGAMALLIRDVTRAKRVREELRSKEAHLRLLVEQMPAILWTTDTQLRITSTVGAGLAGVDLQPTEVIGMSMRETLGPDDPESTPVTAHARALRGQSLSHDMEWKGRTFQVRVEPLRNPERRIAGTIGVVLDVTDHRQTVAELKARVRQQAAIAELGQTALAGGDLEGLLHEATRMVCRTLDVELSELLEVVADGKPLRQRAGSGWGRPGRAAVPAGSGSPGPLALETGEPVSVEDLGADPRFAASPLVVVHRAVSSLSVLVHGRGRPLGVLSAHATLPRPFSEDDRNFLQAAANVLAAALDRREAEAAQNRLVALLEATTDGVAIAGADHRLLYANRAGRAMLGLDEGTDLARLRLEDFYPGALRSRFLNEVIPAALRKGAWSGEIDLRGRTGQTSTVSQVVLAHRSPQGSLEFLSTVARDLGERLRLEEQLRQAQKMEAVGRLAGGIAHDFNNLLCVITGYSEMALLGMPADAPLRPFLTEINKAGNRAAALTRQLLAFGRKQLLAPKVLDLNALVRDTEGMLRRLIGEDIEFTAVLDANLPPVKADPNQLEQVLMNLVVNARDALPQGGRLEVRTRRVSPSTPDASGDREARPEPWAVLSVADTGCGMDEATRARIFEPFFTTKEVGKGTGLGLAMVYGIVNQSGGHIEVESAPGRGTTFRVWLPPAECAPANDAAAPPAGVPTGTETVLLAEDEEGVRFLAAQVLRGRGYTVLEAGDGEEALALGESHPGPIHLLLTDVVMPRLSGGHLAGRLARKRPETRVLFMSGFADSALVRHEVANGEVDCLFKPFTPEALARKVRDTLDEVGAPA